jgi:hypothetical protein
MKSLKKLFFVFSIFALFSHANAEAKTTINTKLFTQEKVTIQKH